MNTAKPKSVEIGKKQQKKPRAKRSKRKPAAARLRAAVDKTKVKDCNSVAEALVDNAKKGDVQSLKLLYSMARSAELEGESEGANKIRSMALELANSPQWTGPSPAEEQDEDGEKSED